MDKSRRKFIVGTAVASAGVVAAGAAQHEHHDMAGMGTPESSERGVPAADKRVEGKRRWHPLS